MGVCCSSDVRSRHLFDWDTIDDVDSEPMMKPKDIKHVQYVFSHIRDKAHHDELEVSQSYFPTLLYIKDRAQYWAGRV